MFKWVNRSIFLRLSLFGVISYSSFWMQIDNFKVYASTVDDVRELIGRQRIDETFTSEEIQDITANYIKAERNNIVAKMFELGDSIVISDDTENIQLLSVIDTKKQEFAKTFKSGNAIDDVLEKKTELDNLITKKNKLKEDGVELDVEFTPNSWTQKYAEVQKMVNAIEKGVDIGDVGLKLHSPVTSQFLITSPFGTRIDPFNKTESWHSGLDLNAQLGEPVLALWNGIVSDTYSGDPIGGNVVEISHGDGVKTRYLHLYAIDVKPGDTVSQYQTIGKAGSTGRSTGVHLHLEVSVDGILTNPILLFGQYGINALRVYVSTHPGQYEEASKLITEIKNAPDKQEEDMKAPVGDLPPTYKREEPTDTVDIIGVLPEGHTPPNPGLLDDTSLRSKESVPRSDKKETDSKAGDDLWGQRANGE